MTNTILTKEANDGYLVPVVNSFAEYAPKAFVVGAGAASLAYLSSQIAKYVKEKKENEEAEKGSKDVLEVEIPNVQKKADPSNIENTGGSLMHNALAVLSSVIGATLGYKGVKALTDMKQKEEYNKKLEHAKNEYSEALSSSMLSSKEAMSNLFPAIDGLVNGIVKNINLSKSADGPGLVRDFISLPFTLAALSSIVAHNYVYDLEESKKEKEYKKPKPPVSIRLVSKPVDPEEEVNTEKQLQLEDKPKTANLMATLADFTTASKIMDGRDHAEVQKEIEKDKKQQSEPAEGRSEDIANNSILVHTKDGDVTVDAADKRTKELLGKNKKKLTHILASGMNSLNS